jgi:A/G-specific adenine glycosylase
MAPILKRPGGGVKPAPEPLLDWYDRHGRDLPWRVRSGRPDPYRVWLSEIMLQQTTTKAVAPYYEAFLARFPTLRALADAPLHEVLKAWAGLGYYARARNLHRAAQLIRDRCDGRMPESEAALRELPGIGAYTAAAVAAIAFGARATPVDGNVERVIARLFAVDAPLPGARGRLKALAESLTPEARPGDFAQALMDLGATLCTPRKPACALCPWANACVAGLAGDAEAYPRKERKPDRPLHRGAAFFARRADGAVLIRTRPLQGLFGGMSEIPSTEWVRTERDWLAQAPLDAAWRRLPGVVRHGLTHMELELAVYAAEVPAAPPPDDMRWVPREALDFEALPSLMRKVLTHAETGLAPPAKAAMGEGGTLV